MSTPPRERTKGRVPAGPPRTGEDRPPLKSVTFKADPQTLEALGRLEARLGLGVRARRSSAIRRAIQDADAAERGA